MFQILFSLELSMLIFVWTVLGFIVITHWPHFVCHVTKVDVPSLVTYFNWTSVSDWYVLWCSDWNQKERSSKEIGLHAQNMICILC
jgi:hypothetical protein